MRSKKHKTKNSLLCRVVLRDASRIVKQQHHSSSSSGGGQLPFGVSGWLLCWVSGAERVLCVSASWLSLVALVAP